MPFKSGQIVTEHLLYWTVGISHAWYIFSVILSKPKIAAELQKKFQYMFPHYFPSKYDTELISDDIQEHNLSLLLEGLLSIFFLGVSVL
jgi:hypothetical protein